MIVLRTLCTSWALAQHGTMSCFGRRGVRLALAMAPCVVLVEAVVLARRLLQMRRRGEHVSMIYPVIFKASALEYYVPVAVTVCMLVNLYKQRCSSYVRSLFGAIRRCHTSVWFEAFLTSSCQGCAHATAAQGDLNIHLDAARLYSES